MLISTEELIDRLSALDWTYSDVVTTYLSHNVHPYPAKFIPQIPHALIETLSEAGETVWDPFGGSGTTALEALLLWRNCVSTDLNPLGTLSGVVKTSILSNSDCDQIENIISYFEEISKTPELLIQWQEINHKSLEKYIPDIPKIDKWFCPNAKLELSYLRQHIVENTYNPLVKHILLLSFSKTVGIVSNQEAETNYRAVNKSLPECHTIKVFIKTLRGVTRKVKDFNSYLAKQGYSQIPTIHFFTRDATSDGLVGEEGLLKDESVDLIITSPPYPKALDYFLYHRFRLFWLGYDPRKLSKHDIGAHIRFMNPKYSYKEYEAEISVALRNCYRALRKGRYAALVLGGGTSHGKSYNAVERFSKIAEENGFQTVTALDRAYPAYKRTVQKSAGQIAKEYILVLKK